MKLLVRLGSWNERHRLLCLAALRRLSRTVAADSMRHLVATVHGAAYGRLSVRDGGVKLIPILGTVRVCGFSYGAGCEDILTSSDDFLTQTRRDQDEKGLTGLVPYGCQGAPGDF